MCWKYDINGCTNKDKVNANVKHGGFNMGVSMLDASSVVPPMNTDVPVFMGTNSIFLV